MLTAIVPKLPMRDQEVTHSYFVDQLGFTMVGSYDGYLIVERDGFQLHFFLSADLDPRMNDGQVYIRTDAIDALYHDLIRAGVRIHPNGALSNKPWGQREFALLDPDHNLLTFGRSL